MASKHRGGAPSGKAVKQPRSTSGALYGHRRLGFEALEDRRLLTVIPVTTIADENNGTGFVSLREAIGMANTGDTITFAVNGTIQLLGGPGFGQISIGKSMTIQGPGSNLLTIKAFDPDPSGTNNSNGSRVFFVNDNFFALDVTISGLTLTNGDPTLADENDGGGAIRNAENLTLNACVLTGNYAANGGAIYSTANSLTLNDCTISNNTGADGGAILVTGGSLAVTRATIANNQTSNAGGGILSRTSQPVTIVDSTISGNFADEGGGGIYQYSGSLSVTGSTISGNSADANHDTIGPGGGIYNATGSVSISNCTISDNSAGGGGGGVFSNTAQAVSIKFSTITGNVIGNVGGVSGGGINSANTTTLDHTIVAGNIQGAATRDDVSGTFNARYSLIGDKRSAAVNNAGGSLIGTTASFIDAQLGPLANNGGLTFTHAPLSGSPAIDAGDPTAIAGAGGVPQFDQRGTPFSRVIDFDGVGGARIDMGAVEMVVSGPALFGDYNLNHSVDAADYVLWRKTNNTNVAPAYSGADGDGNSIVNSNDYTVWRSHFGNSSPGAGSAAQGLSDDPSDSATSFELPVGDKASPLDLATWVTTSDVGSQTTMVRANQSVAADRMAMTGLLLAIADGSGEGTPTTHGGDGGATIESSSGSEIHDNAFERFADSMESPFLAL